MLCSVYFSIQNYRSTYILYNHNACINYMYEYITSPLIKYKDYPFFVQLSFFQKETVYNNITFKKQNLES